MFSDKLYIDETILSGSETSFLLIDKNGKIVSMSEELKKEFSGVTNIFDVLSEGSRRKLSDPIISDKIRNNVIQLERLDSPSDIEVNIDSIKIKGKVLYKLNIISISKSEGKSTLKIDLYSGDVEDYLSRSTKKIIEIIKSNYPFTIIGKSKTQRILDEYEGFFWIKDPDGKIVIANRSFSGFLGIPKRKLEGKREKEILPNYLYRIFSEAHEYVLRTGNNILLEDISGSLFLRQMRLKKIAQIPLVDIDNNIVAILSFSIDNIDTGKFDLNEQLTTNLDVSDWLIPVILIDEDGNVLSYSHSAKELFITALRNRSFNLNSILAKGSSQLLNDFFTNQEEKKTDFSSEIENKKIKFMVQKVVQSEKSTLALVYLSHDQDNEIISSEKMYDTILHSYPLPALIYNAENLKFLDVNNAALKLYGYTREEFLSLDLTDLYAPEDIQTLIETPEESKSNGNGIIMRQKRKDGSFIIVEINNKEIDFNGILSLFSTIRDVTEEIELEKKLQLYKAAFENSGYPIAITDNHGFVKYINDAFIEKFGYTKAEIEQNPISSILVDKDRGILNSNLFQSEFAEEKRITLQVKTSEGTQIETTVVGTPIFGYKDKVERFSLIFKITEESVAKSQEINGELKKSGIDSTFLSNLFHELLTPLNVIIGFVQELSESIENPNEEQREAIQIIDENQRVLLQTMDIAVEFSHLEQDYVELSVTDIKFVDLLNDLQESTKKIAESNEVKFNYGKISSSLEFVSDKHKFITFLRQMINFALIMTHESEIFISGNYFENNKFVIGIKDQKSGISEELLGNLKAVFVDDEINIRKNFGLSRFTVRLVRKLLEILNGEIRSIPSAAHPTEFGIVFPLKLEVPEISIEQEMLENAILEHPSEQIPIPEEPKPQPLPQPEPEPEPVLPKEKELDISKLSCLYVEDQVDSQILFKVQMKELKTIEFANSFEKALPLLKSKKFDFIVMDINLQGEYNGLDALKIIKKMPGYENIPIIAVTAYVVPGAAEKFIQAGFSDFINKPLLREKVLESLQKVM